MMRQIKRPQKLLLAGLLMAAPYAGAGLHLEGFGGIGLLYSGGGALSEIDFEAEAAAEGASSEEGAASLKSWHTQYSGGGRIGWSKLGLALGLDISASLVAEKEGQSWMILPGAFVSYKLPLFFRIYGAITPYGFLMRGQGAYIHSAALKAGLSLLSLPFVSLNAECQAARAFGPQKNADFYSLAALLAVSL